ncbi:MAG: hypothetical protein HKO56_09545, partial [Bacteroidia bacterium]|nr:hypothetical protein [Bacteroidia bacterium]
RQATVTVVDSTPPEITSPAIDETVECDGSGNTTQLTAWLNNFGGATSEDVCGMIIWNTPVLMNTIEGCGNTVEYVYMLNANDECGNTSSNTIASFYIIDTTSPTIDVEAIDASFNCNGSGNATDLQTWLDNNGGASASDICSTPLTWSYDLIQESDLCDLTGAGTYRFTVVDDCGNSSITEATFTITDTENPTITNPASDLTVVCDGNNIVDELLNWLNSNGGATATDNCNEISWSNNYGQILPGSCNGTGSIEVTFTVTDQCGNASSSTATLFIIDNNDPVWTIDPIDLTLECTADTDPLNAIQAWLDAAGNGDAFDSCSVLVYSNDFTTLSGGCGGTTGSALVLLTATDACGNFTTKTATVTIVDNFAPEVTSPALSETVECDGAGNTTELNTWLGINGGATAEDYCGDVTWNTPVLIETIQGCGGTVEYVYSFSADDECGNTSANTIASFITIDTTSPVINPDAINVVVECDGSGNDVALQAYLDNVADAGATDVCSEPLTWEWDLVKDEDNCSSTGTQTYRFTVVDACGNSSISEGTFTIEDTTPPTIVGGADYSGECDQSNANNDDELLSWLNNNAGATASDICGNFVWSNDYHIDNWVDGCNDSRSINVTFTTTDECGNTSNVTFNFSTGDNTAPMFINCPRPPVVVDAPEGWCSAFVNFSLPLAQDN